MLLDFAIQFNFFMLQPFQSFSECVVSRRGALLVNYKVQQDNAVLLDVVYVQLWGRCCTGSRKTFHARKFECAFWSVAKLLRDHASEKVQHSFRVGRKYESTNLFVKLSLRVAVNARHMEDARN